MIIVYHGSRLDNLLHIGNYNTIKEASKAIYNYVTECGFECRYVRAWEDESGYTVEDYGSWSDFIFIKEIN